ncbi:MAG: peptidylprolyl isomerase [Ferruginibacter sp.]
MKTLKIITTFTLVCFFTIYGSAQVKKPPTKVPVTTKPVTKKPNNQVANAPKQVKVSGTRVKVTTDSGVIIIRLYDNTPLHRDNFIKLVKEHFFDSLLFHRVIPGFMIQGGDPNSKYAPAGQMLGNGDVGYTIPANFDSTRYHKKGALAAARQPDHVNPTKASSACQFYIVQGKTWTDEELNMFEMQRGYKYSPAQRLLYKTVGGTAQLDMNYTVFGEVESGFEVIDKIATVKRDGYNRPFGDIRMYIELIK